MYAKTSEAKYKSMSESSSVTDDEKGNGENGECKADDKLGKENHKTKSKKDYNKDTIKTEFRLKSEKSIGKDEKGNTKGRKYKIDDDKKEKMDNKTQPKNNFDKEKSDDGKVFKRCTGCFLMTYCDKVDIESPWWRSLEFSLSWIMKMADSREIIRLDESEITDPKLIEKIDYHQKNVKNVSMITKNNLWNRFKLWPVKINNSLVLLLPNDVFCFSCNADLSGQVVGFLNASNPPNPSPFVVGGVGNNGGVIATCSPFRNLDCWEGYNSLNFTDKDKQEYQTIAQKTRICHMCLKMSTTSHRCTECWASQYCSKDCQVADWKDFHETVCSTWAEDPARRLMSSKKQKQITKEKVFEIKEF